MVKDICNVNAGENERNDSSSFLWDINCAQLSMAFWTDFLADLHVYEPTNRTWTDLSDSMSGSVPAARYRQGFEAAGGQLYLFAGFGWSGVYDWSERASDQPR